MQIAQLAGQLTRDTQLQIQIQAKRYTATDTLTTAVFADVSD